MSGIWEISQNVDFWVILGHFRDIFPDLGKTGIFPKNRASSRSYVYGSLTSCKRQKKTNEPIPRKIKDERTQKGDFIGPGGPKIGIIRLQ